MKRFSRNFIGIFLLLSLLVPAPTLKVQAAALNFSRLNYAVGIQPLRVKMEDFNGDGRLDLAVVNYGSNTVTVRLNDGDGTFHNNTATYNVDSKPMDIATGDFNGDGKIDLISMNSTNHTVTVLLNDGDGTFSNTGTAYTIGSQPQGITAGDFNLDGKLDLASVGKDNGVSILLGNGAGGFTAPVSYAVGTNPLAIAAGDLNKDGRLDLVVANSAESGSVSVLLNTGIGNFAVPVSYSMGAYPYMVAVEDLNGDGSPDLAVSNRGDNTVSVRLNDGNGNFVTPPVPYGVGDSPVFVVSGDLNGDARPDLVAADISNNSVTMLLNNGDGTFDNATNYSVGSSPVSLAIGDVNGNGKLDLAVTNYDNNNMSVLYNSTLFTPAGTFSSVSNYGGAGHTSQSVVTADFNVDGKPDIAIANETGDNVRVLLADGAGSFAAPVDYTVGDRPYDMAAGDFNRDGKPDLVVANRGQTGINKTVGVLLNNGNGSFASQVTYETHINPQAVTVGDFNCDGKPDLAAANYGSADISVFLGNGDGTFGTESRYEVQIGPSDLASADFNRDGKPDLAVVNYGASSVSVLMGNGTGGFGSATHFSVGSYPSSVAVEDFNLDGKPDLAVSNRESNNVSVLLNNGSGSFASQVPYAADKFTQTVATGDFNRDGNPDLAVANYQSASVSILPGNGAGGFDAASDYTLNGVPVMSLAVGDFNTDGRPDIVFVNDGGDLADIRLNMASAPTITAAFTPSSISVGQVSTLTFTIANPNPANTNALSGVAFSNTLPSGLVIAEQPGVSSDCGGPVTATAGSRTISLSGGRLAGTATCTLAVNVTSVDANTYTSTTGAISSVESGAGQTSNTARLTVNRAATQSSLQVSASSISIGSSLSLTAMVNPVDLIAMPVDGTVTFRDGDQVLGTAPLTHDVNGDRAIFTTSELTVGNHTLSASYDGSANFLTSSSDPVTVTVTVDLYKVYMPGIEK